MEPQMKLVLLVLVALLGCSLSLGCDFTEREASDRAPYLVMLISRRHLEKGLTPERCTEACCRSAGCDTAVHELRDGGAQCHLFECKDQCEYVEVTDAKYRVFTRTDAPANPAPHIQPLQLGPSALTENKETAEKQEKSGKNSDVCSLPPQTGLCEASFTRFYFNPESGNCRRFNYGGCGGNANNFETQAECEQKCSGGKKGETKSETQGVCALPAKVGPCRGSFRRFYFNPASGACEQFIYGGCRGNSNNFETQGECEQNCSGADKDETKDETKGSDGGEAPSDGKTLRLAAQREMDPEEYKELCQSPLVVGPCRAAFRRWFFNQTSGLCQRFIYGGCKGNKNNHESEDDCSSACSGVKVLPSQKKIVPEETVPEETVPEETVPQETVPQETVPQETVPQETVPQETVPQESDEDKGVKVLPSQKKIVPEKSDEDKAHCEAAPETGPCRAAFSMFYFDSEAQICKSFIYGGCGGNSNRYKSKDECEERCTDTGASEGRGRARHRWGTAFFLILSLAAVSFLLLTALVFITVKRHRVPRPALSIRSDKEELLSDSERSSVDSLPLPESPTRS